MCPSPAVSSSPSSSLQYREVAGLLSIVNICSSMDMTNSPAPAANQAPPHALSTAITAACSCPHHVSILQPSSHHVSSAASCILYCTVYCTLLYCHVSILQPSSQHVSLAASCILVIILAAGSQNPGPGYSYLWLVWRHELCLGY